MARSTYTFGGRTFTSRDKVRLWMAEIRAAYSPGETITDPLHKKAVTDLLQCHVDREQKIGSGIKRLFVDYAPDHPSLCFWVERVGGIATDFGVPACLQGIGVLNRQILSTTCSTCDRGIQTTTNWHIRHFRVRLLRYQLFHRRSARRP